MGEVTPFRSRAADSVVAVFDPARLAQARLAKAWTKKHLAEEVGVSTAAVSQYESGVTRPRGAQLDRLAAALDVPVEYFAVGRPRAGNDAACMHFRSLRSMRAYERDQAAVFAADLWELSHALEQKVVLPHVDLPDSLHVGVDDPVSAGTLAARETRAEWRLGDGPVPHLVRLLEAHGVVVGLLPFSDSGRVDSFADYQNPRPVIVLTEDRPDVYRHRFSAAHELGHLIVHGNVAHPGDVRHERQADAFAAEFLTPTAALQPTLTGRVDFGRLLHVQQEWGVSLESLLYRSRELGVLSDASHRRARIKLATLRADGVVRIEPFTRYPGELPELLARAADAGGYQVSELADQLRWPYDKVSAMLRRQPAKPTLRIAGTE